MANELVQIAHRYRLKILVCGTGWDKIGPLPLSIIVVGPRPYNAQFEIFRQSKFMINLDPNWTHGIHDRVSNAMAVGCAVITNANHFIPDNFIVGREILTFGATEQLSGLLLQNDPAQIASNALEAYPKSHSWQQRMRHLLDSI